MNLIVGPRPDEAKGASGLELCTTTWLATHSNTCRLPSPLVLTIQLLWSGRRARDSVRNTCPALLTGPEGVNVHRFVRRVTAVLCIAMVAIPVLDATPAEASPASSSTAGHQSGVQPLNYGYFASFRNGATTPTITTVTGGLSAGITPSGGLYITWGPGGHYDVISDISKVGRSDLASVSLPLPAGILCDTADPTGATTGFTQIDHITMSGSTVVSAAMQFECAVSNQYADVVTGGTIAFNLAADPGTGYYLYGSDGSIQGFGNTNYLSYLGTLALTPLNRPIVGMAPTSDGAGYWMVASDGGIFAFGDAGFYGSAGNLVLNQAIVGMAATPDGKGYWLVASDGGIFAYGDAAFYGSMGGKPLNKTIVGMAASPAGGYWLVASDGGIFAFGNAPFYGSTGNLVLNKAVVGMTASASGHGYWFVASDGGVFNYGDAAFHGSTGNLTLAEPVIGMLATQDGHGYWLVASDGGIFSFNAPFNGSLGGLGLTGVAGIAP